MKYSPALEKELQKANAVDAEARLIQLQWLILTFFKNALVVCVDPYWTELGSGRISDLKRMPGGGIEHPRIDMVVTRSGTFGIIRLVSDIRPEFYIDVGGMSAATKTLTIGSTLSCEHLRMAVE